MSNFLIQFIANIYYIRMFRYYKYCRRPLYENRISVIKTSRYILVHVCVQETLDYIYYSWSIIYDRKRWWRFYLHKEKVLQRHIDYAISINRTAIFKGIWNYYHEAGISEHSKLTVVRFPDIYTSQQIFSDGIIKEKLSDKSYWTQI